MLELLILGLLVIPMSPDHPPIQEQGLATTYDPFGKDITYIRGRRVNMCPQRLACSWWGYSVQPNDRFLAHRTLPCGMRVWIRSMRTKKVSSATVIDRGTFGAVGCHAAGGLRCISCNATGAKHGWCVKIHRYDPGTWRGIADLSPALSEELGFSGMEKVQILYTKKAFHEAHQEWKLRRRFVETRRVSWMQHALQIPKLSSFWKKWVSGDLSEFVEEQLRLKNLEV